VAIKIWSFATWGGVSEEMKEILLEKRATRKKPKKKAYLGRTQKKSQKRKDVEIEKMLSPSEDPKKSPRGGKSFSLSKGGKNSGGGGEDT